MSDESVASGRPPSSAEHRAEHETLDLKGVSSSPTLSAELTLKKGKKTWFQSPAEGQLEWRPCEGHSRSQDSDLPPRKMELPLSRCKS